MVAQHEMTSGNLPSPFSGLLQPKISFYFESTQPALPEAEQLSLRSRALKLLGEASNLSRSLSGDSSAKRALEIAAVKVILGESPTIHIQAADEKATRRFDIGHNLILLHASEVVAYSGDFDQAYDLALRASNSFREPWPLQYAAEIVNGMGGDAQRFTDQSVEILEQRRQHKVKKFPGLVARAYANTAVHMAKLGRDPQPFLSAAEEILLVADQGASYAYESLARAHAHCGNNSKAKQLVENIHLDSTASEQHHRERALVSIARIQAERREFAQALQTARKSGFLPLVADIYLARAYSQTLEGRNPTIDIDRAIEIAKSIESYGHIPGKYKLALVYAEAGRILAPTEKGSGEFFDWAIEVASSLPTYLQAETLMEIARAMHIVGENPQPQIDKALSIYDSHPDIGSLYNIHAGALEAGCDEYIDETMARLDCLDFDVDTVNSWKSLFLVKSAQVFAREAVAS